MECNNIPAIQHSPISLQCIWTGWDLVVSGHIFVYMNMNRVILLFVLQLDTNRWKALYPWGSDTDTSVSSRL